MTVGFPDWSRLQLQGGQQLLDVQIAVSGEYVSPVIDCLGFSFLQVSTNDGGNLAYKEVTVIFYTANNVLSGINSTSWIVTPGSLDFQQIPCMGRWATISIQNLDTPSGETVTIYAYGSNVQLPHSFNAQNSQPLATFNGNIASNTSQYVFSSSTQFGPATMSGLINSGSQWYIALQFWSKVDIDWRYLVVLYGATFGEAASQRISLPPAPTRLEIRNESSVTQLTVGGLAAG